MSKIINNIKEKLSRRKSSEPTLKQTPAGSTGADTSLAHGNDHGKANDASSKEPSFSIQPHPAVRATSLSLTQVAATN